MEEMIDLYDNNRQKTGITCPRHAKLPKDHYRMVIHICIFNKKNEMLIQKRAKTKKVWASFWDFSVGGGVSVGETSTQSATRELKEELGIEYDFSSTCPYFTAVFDEGFDDFFIIKKDVDLSTVVMQKSEVSKVKWASKNQVLSLLNNNKFIKYKKSFIEILFEFPKGRGVFE